MNKDIFVAVRGIPFPDILAAFHGGEIRKNKTVCSFHAEKTASFHVYVDGFRCFGCGEAGDGVAFVAKLLNLRPVDAARLIAGRFNLPVSGPVSPEVAAKARQERAAAQTERELQGALAAWAWATARRCRIITDTIKFLFEIHGPDLPDDLLPLVHRLELFEHWRDVLIEGDTGQQLVLFRDRDVRWWFN